MVKSIGDRTTYSYKGKELVLIISGKVERWKEALLMAWFFSWNIVGGILIYQTYTGTFGNQEKIILFVTIIFWAYFEFRIGRMCAWRLWGKELIRVNDKKLTYKRAIKRYGKAHAFFLENIGTLQIVNVDENSWQANLGSSFWVWGGETIGFDHLNKHMKMGMQLNEEDSLKIRSVIQQAIIENKKVRAKKQKELEREAQED